MKPSDVWVQATESPVTLDWQWLAFSAFSPAQLYGWLKLRQDVFVLEQQCLFADLDERDAAALHLIGMGADGRVMAGLRIFDATPDAPHWHIGRIVLDPSCRGTHLGHEMIRMALVHCQQHGKGTSIEIEAQAALQGYYEGFGFRATSDPYWLDGILHRMMHHPNA